MLVRCYMARCAARPKRSVIVRHGPIHFPMNRAHHYAQLVSAMKESQTVANIPVPRGLAKRQKMRVRNGDGKGYLNLN